jgi:hypothetical protein
MNKLLYISHSQLDLWLACPKKWGYKYVDKIQVPTSGPLLEGSCYHKTLENNFRYKLEHGVDLSLDLINDAVSTNWNIVQKEAYAINWRDDDPDRIYDEVRGLVNEYMISTAPQVTPVVVEETFLTDIEDVKFACVVDLVDNHGTVIDHKTSSKSYNQTDIDRDMQATAEAFSLGKAIMFQNHVAVKNRQPYIQIAKSYRTDKDILWWINMVQGILAHMKTGYFPPRCIKEDYRSSKKFCDYWDLCRKDLATSYH